MSGSRGPTRGRRRGRWWVMLPMLIGLAGIASCGDDHDMSASPTPTPVPGPAVEYAYVINQPPPMPPTPAAAARITVYEVNPSSGMFTEVSQAALPVGLFAPVALTATPGGEFIYVALSNGEFSNGAIAGYAVDPNDGSLTPVPGQPQPTGQGPSALTVDPMGRFVYVANTCGNSVSAYQIRTTTGSLSAAPGSPFSANTAIALAVHPSGKVLYVVEGGENQVQGFRIDPSNGSLFEPAPPAPTFTIPTGIAVEPSGTYAYVSALQSAPNGGGGTDGYEIASALPGLVPLSNSPFGGAGSAIALTPNGRFVYVLSPDAMVSGLAIDEETGTLTPIPGAVVAAGEFPNGITIDSAGRFAYVPNIESDTISIYALDASSGAITSAGSVDVPGVRTLALRAPE